jgi:hypothetical protein
MNFNNIKKIMNSVFYALCTLLLLLPAGNADGGTYTSSKHGTDADRSVVDSAFPYTTRGHCAHCHEQHASIDGSEPSPPGLEGQTSYALFKSNFGFDKNELCYACHETFLLDSMPVGYGRYGIYQGKTKYNNSIHYTNGNMVWSPDAIPPGPPFDDAGNCHNCHNPHGYDDGGGLVPQMLFARDSQTGDSPAYEMGCEACHDGTQGGVLKDVKSQLDKTYSHPTHTYNNRHSLPETGKPSGSSFGPANRHAECVDCHNPHALGSAGTVHTAPGNAVSDVINNVWGIEPIWPSIWTQPTTFTIRKPPLYSDGAEYEYQICFKCHSYYGLGTVTNGVSTITGPSGESITDQAWEFNVYNKSAHPAAVTANNQTGSYSPQALTSAQMSSPWDTGVGSQTMYCSDCHGADNESLDAKGPHGSNRIFMLKGNAQYWPAKTDGSTLWTLADLGGADAGNNLFCTNCHPNDRTQNNAHSENGHWDGILVSAMSCVQCHTAVPHGSKRSRLITYSSEPSPYDYNNNTLGITQYKKASGPNAYVAGDCQASCHSVHSASVSGADP